MLRRVIRDMQFRNYSPRSTIAHWSLVRRAELRYIVPELRRAHALVNSFLPYELPIMKSRLHAALVPLLSEFKAEGEDSQEAFERASRVRALFEQIPGVSDENLVPSQSLLREFIGGSAYEYR